VEHLLPLSRILSFAQGETIIQQGDAQDSRVFFLLHGSVSVHMDGKYILTLKRPWDIFGEMSICSAAPRSASVVADTSVEVICIDAAVLHSPGQEANYQFKYYFYNMFAAIMPLKSKK
jgi:CRP-like cAMP-binding protein